MKEMGVRELKESLSETLRAVGEGQQVRVTLRGRAVADIVPAGASKGEDPIRRLVADGHMTAPTLAHGSAPRLARSSRSASALVLAERESER